MMGMFAVLAMMCRRSYEAFDTVVDAIELSTVEFVQIVGQESNRAVPILVGAAVTFVLLLLKVVVQKFWTTRKEQMMLNGESPEGNAVSFPLVPWLSKDMMSMSVRNLGRCYSLCFGSGWCCAQARHYAVLRLCCSFTATKEAEELYSSPGEDKQSASQDTAP
jgi:tetrahydromethanopterin S-methyltransferase subunit G